MTEPRIVTEETTYIPMTQETVPMAWAVLIQPSGDVKCPYCQIRMRRSKAKSGEQQTCDLCGGTFRRW